MKCVLCKTAKVNIQNLSKSGKATLGFIEKSVLPLNMSN